MATLASISRDNFLFPPTATDNIVMRCGVESWQVTSSMQLPSMGPNYSRGFLFFLVLELQFHPELTKKHRKCRNHPELTKKHRKCREFVCGKYASVLLSLTSSLRRPVNGSCKYEPQRLAVSHFNAPFLGWLPFVQRALI